MLAGLVLAVGLSGGAVAFGLVHEFTVQDVERIIRSWGAWGVAASIGLMILHSFVPFPAEFIAICNGLAYGPFWGTVVTWTGAMLGAYLAFGLSRALGRPFAEAMVERKNWNRLDEWTARQGWQVALVSRFTPVIAFNLINYAAGLTRISWWTFTWTTGIGILPLTVIMVVMGDNLGTMPWQVWSLLAVGGVVVWLAIRGVLRLTVSSQNPERGGV